MLIGLHNSINIFVDWKQIALNLCNSLHAYCWIDLLVVWFKGIIPSYYAFFSRILILELNLTYWPYIVYTLCWCCSGWQLLDIYFIQGGGGGSNWSAQKQNNQKWGQLFSTLMYARQKLITANIKHLKNEIDYCNCFCLRAISFVTAIFCCLSAESFWLVKQYFRFLIF